MALVKLSIDVAGLAEARATGERLALLVPEPVAVTEFERGVGGGWRVEAYFDGVVDPGATAAMLGIDAGQILSEPVPDENWVAVSQAALPPVDAGRFVVHGSHDRARIGFRLGAIEIDAGEAFGTAHHATTLGCLAAIERLTHRRRFRSVLDLGCGSGVLAIAAARAQPAARILASDIDPEAVAVARGNVARNRLRRRIVVLRAAGLGHAGLRAAAPFELVLANILAGPLVRLAPRIAGIVRRGGVAVLSGILAEQSAEVEAAWRAVGFSVYGKQIRNGWATLELVRR